MRRQELIDLKLYDLDASRGVILVREGKGEKDRRIPIGGRALFWIGRYTQEVRPDLCCGADDGTLFLAATGAAMHPLRLAEIVRHYIDRAGIGKRGACHLLRHSMATLMLQNGADIRFIQAMLGHADLSPTEFYTQVSIMKLKAVHEATHPARLRPRAGAGLDSEEADEAAAEALLAALDREGEDEG